MPKRRRLAEPPQTAERRVSLADPRVRQPSLVRSYLAPSYASAGSEHAYALAVLAELLGSGCTSRLYRRLVVELGVATGVGCYYYATCLDPTTFRIYASPRPDVELDTLEAALDATPARAVGGLQHLLALDDALGSGERSHVVYDLGEVRGLDYYTGVHFEVFVSGTGRAAGAGGRYDELMGRFGRPMPAVGVSIVGGGEFFVIERKVSGSLDSLLHVSSLLLASMARTRQ